MKRWLKIQKEPIPEAELLQQRSISNGIGAVIYFLGTVREREGEGEIAALDYEAFEPMAVHQFNLIFDAAEKQWPIESIRLVHRTGVVPVNQPSLWVEVTAPHRGEAFAACQFVIDEMKKLVPIWKRAVKKTE
ncbi:MAG: molybdenum cofactor biosynthesis protein MoaE [Verrucomicrobiota bacterium]